jgi:hypothetical protein
LRSQSLAYPLLNYSALSGRRAALLADNNRNAQATGNHAACVCFADWRGCRRDRRAVVSTAGQRREVMRSSRPQSNRARNLHPLGQT